MQMPARPPTRRLSNALFIIGLCFLLYGVTDFFTHNPQTTQRIGHFGAGPPEDAVAQADRVARGYGRVLRSVEDAKNSHDEAACGYTKTSPHWVADSHGFICPRSLQNKTTHCCLHYSTSITASNSMRHVCTSCDSHSCCPTHEECVSCCLSPTHTTLRSFMLSLRSMKRYDVSEGDTFGLCVVLCRSNSRSVVHENAYRHERHHCFAGEPRVDGNLYRGIFDFAKPVGK